MPKYNYVEFVSPGYWKELKKHPPLSLEEEQRLTRRYLQEGDKAARDRVVMSNLRFVVKVAIGYRRYGLADSDLIAEGSVGLFSAMDLFNPDRGVRFITYAFYWIRAYILAYIVRQRRIVSIKGAGKEFSRVFFQLYRERRKLEAAGVDQSEFPVRLAKQLGVSVEQLSQLQPLIEREAVSLDDPIAYGESVFTRLEILPSESEPHDERFMREERLKLVRDRAEHAAKSWTKREQLILREHILAEEPQTFRELGRQLKISHERVRQIENKIKQKLAPLLEDLVGHE